MLGVVMRAITISETHFISGGLIVDGKTCHVPTTGIASSAYSYIEYAMQKSLDNEWTDDQSRQYIEQNGAMPYFGQYMDNFNQALWG